MSFTKGGVCRSGFCPAERWMNYRQWFGARVGDVTAHDEEELLSSAKWGDNDAAQLAEFYY